MRRENGLIAMRCATLTNPFAKSIGARIRLHKNSGAINPLYRRHKISTMAVQASVAQLDGASGFGSEGCRFESCRMRQKIGVGSTHETARQTRLRLRSFSDVFWRSDAFGSGSQRRAGLARTCFPNPSVDLLVVVGSALDKMNLTCELQRFVNLNYRPFDASDWPLTDSGLLGPVTLTAVVLERPASAAD